MTENIGDADEILVTDFVVFVTIILFKYGHRTLKSQKNFQEKNPVTKFWKLHQQRIVTKVIVVCWVTLRESDFGSWKSVQVDLSKKPLIKANITKSSIIKASVE